MTAAISAPTRPGRGRGALRPEGVYEPEPEVRESFDGLEVPFLGDDGRRWVFSFEKLPVPGIHRDLAAAFAARTGVHGPRRTLASATSSWQTLCRFVNWLGDLPRPPRDVTGLRPSHLERFYRHRFATVSKAQALRDVADLVLTLEAIPARDRLQPALVDVLGRRGHARRIDHEDGDGPPGYSERERELIFKAAREDVAAIRQRVRGGRELARRAVADPGSIEPGERYVAELLAEVAKTGRVPQLSDEERQVGGPKARSRRALASQVFILSSDLAPLLVYGVCLTGRNGETLKELPAEHRVLEDRAVALSLTKRRRGKALTFETAHWETGGHTSDQLKTPGGYYLLLHELCAWSRAHSQSRHVWSVWLNGSKAGKEETCGHLGPFVRDLGRDVYLGKWAAGKGLTGDDGQPLEISLGRLKKTEDIRRTRAVGGHLPSAVLTNGIETLFRDYLAGDPTVQAWAEEVLDDALREAETAARDFSPQVLDSAAERAARAEPAKAAAALATTEATMRQALSGDLDTVLASCLDFDHHPQTGAACTASFLTCLLCPNALVFERHLPALHALMDELQDALDATDAETWCRRYGVIWLVLTRHILPKFTDRQRRDAAATKPSNGVLAGLDGLKEPT